jgi:hypothetical protein
MKWNKYVKHTLKNFFLVAILILLVSLNLQTSAQNFKMSMATEQETLDLKAREIIWGKAKPSMSNSPLFNLNTSLNMTYSRRVQPPQQSQNFVMTQDQVEQKQSSDNKVQQTVITNTTDNTSIGNNFEDGFNFGLAVNNESLYSLPNKFNSASKIREFLKKNNSFLANYNLETSFESDDDVLNRNPNLSKLTGQKIDFAELVWQLSRSDLGSNCTLSRTICVDMTKNPINPGFVLAMIQRESGLIYGSNARLKPNSEEAMFLLDRATGFLCNESSDKSKSCWDQNPNWKYYKGLFRQSFYMVRSLTLNAKKCENNGVNIYGRTYKTGSTVTHSNKTFTLENAMTCALYIYTPNIGGQKSLYKTMNYLEANTGNYNTSLSQAPQARNNSSSNGYLFRMTTD